MENQFDQVPQRVDTRQMPDKWSFYERDGHVPATSGNIEAIIGREFDYG
jgi:hypothetical protein